MKELLKIRQLFRQIPEEEIDNIINESDLRSIPKETVILRDGQYIKVIPIVIKGLIKVFTTFENKDLLLYYIRPGESCSMSLAASLQNEPSKIFAVTEEDTDILLLPAEKLHGWMKQFPEVNNFFYRQYNLRYTELLETINHLLFNRMDKRLFDYLVEKKRLSQTNPIKISHRQIAGELGTAREVVSRVMKKLENEGKIKQLSNSIEILQVGD